MRLSCFNVFSFYEIGLILVFYIPLCLSTPIVEKNVTTVFAATTTTTTTTTINILVVPSDVPSDFGSDNPTIASDGNNNPTTSPSPDLPTSEPNEFGRIEQVTTSSGLQQQWYTKTCCATTLIASMGATLSILVMLGDELC